MVFYKQRNWCSNRNRDNYLHISYRKCRQNSIIWLLIYRRINLVFRHLLLIWRQIESKLTFEGKRSNLHKNCSIHSIWLNKFNKKDLTEFIVYFWPNQFVWNVYTSTMLSHQLPLITIILCKLFIVFFIW